MIRQVPALVRQNDGQTPKVFVKAITDLEGKMLETIEKQKVTPKKMNATNTRGLNAVRQKMRKIKPDYTKEIDQYKANPDKFMEENAVEEKAPAPKKSKKQPSLAPTGEDDGDDDGFTMVGAGGKAMTYTPESILKHLRTIVEARGRKNTDRLEQIRTMEKLVEVANTDYQKIRVLLTLIPTRFDLTAGTGNQMAQEQWKKYVLLDNQINDC